MFVWAFVTITEGLQRHQPEFYAACQRWFKAAPRPAQLARLLARDYPALRRVSIDYALMEHARNVVVAEGAFAWDDLGSWPALARHLKPDAAGNCARAEFIHVDSARNLVVDLRTRTRTPVAAVGVRDAILVLTDDAVLLADRGRAQQVKDLVRALGESKAHRHLL
jgi:mannose-1-phosphate guanylyltransferase